MTYLPLFASIGLVANIFIIFYSELIAADTGGNAPTIGNDSENRAREEEVTLYANIKFKGLSQTFNLKPGECIGLDSKMKDEASSFKGKCAILFDRAGCTGTKKKIQGNVSTMPFGWNNEVESIGSCTGPIQTDNILTLFGREEFGGEVHILQPSPEPGICSNIDIYSGWAFSVKVKGCLRAWTRRDCKGSHLNISENIKNLTPIGFSQIIMSYELCTNELRLPPKNFTVVVIYAETNRRGQKRSFYLKPGQCLSFMGFGFRGLDSPKSIDANCAYIYTQNNCVGKRIKVIESNLNLNATDGLMGADSTQSCDPGPNPSNESYVMLVRYDGLKESIFYKLKPHECVNLMFEFEKGDFFSFDADCAVLFEDRWCEGARLEIRGIHVFSLHWVKRVSSIGSCVGPIMKRPANITTVTVIDDDRKSSTVEIPHGVCASMTEGRDWGRVQANSVSTSGCVYWYNTGSDCTGMRRKVNGGSVSSGAFEKGRSTSSNPYLGSLQTCENYVNGSSYVAIYEYPQLNIGYNSFVGFNLEPRSCIDLWGARDKWVASIDADCVIVFDGHWCTEEQQKITGAVEDLGDWDHRISSIGSCDGPIPSGRSQNTSVVTFYTEVGLEGNKEVYEMKHGACVAFSIFHYHLSASSVGCVQLYDRDDRCRGEFKILDNGDIEDFMEWPNARNKYRAFKPESGRRCVS